MKNGEHEFFKWLKGLSKEIVKRVDSLEGELKREV